MRSPVILVAALGIAAAPAPPAPALRSVDVTLPDDDGTFPAGAHADLVTANCTACHSASMVLTQPQLTPAQWAATVSKMRDAYKAPIADADVAPIVAYLAALRPAGGK